MKYPYGISDFSSIIREKYFYCDRTDKIPLLEKSDFQLFIRPRRFGKSLVLSMLENYYDVAKKDEFEDLFGKLKIGKNSTELRNSYFILRFDFSCVDPTGSAENRYKALVHDEGPLRTFFKAVKASTSGSMFDRVFITGVSPVVMSDITSGFAENIYFEPEFNDLCGFKQKEIDRRYADLTMIIRPDKRYGKVFDVLIEFKFVKLKDAGLNADKANKLSENELCQIPEIVKQMEDGKKQVKEYGKKLEQRHENLRLKKFVVVALGFERICFYKFK